MGVPQSGGSGQPGAAAKVSCRHLPRAAGAAGTPSKLHANLALNPSPAGNTTPCREHNSAQSMPASRVPAHQPALLAKVHHCIWLEGLECLQEQQEN